ncbi:MAG: hypothetical protein LBJ74_02175 [Heliobacteriaceae bacterium]|jgi:hypothetical protein|nr:hypothetical protein [Heliobacteriaceae bacterium]
MPKPVLGVSTQTFQYLDGSNSTSAGFDAKFTLSNRTSLGTFTGGVTDFKGANAFRVDLKPSIKYDDKGMFSFGSRIRTTVSEESASTQFRITPVKFTVPIDSESKLYLDPHYFGKINYKTVEWSNSAGAFLGYERNFGRHFSGLAEIQAYNLQDFRPKKDTSFNLGISYKW